MEEKTYGYYDGSGNGYIAIDQYNSTIEYDPVKPAFSSSGIYDGGDYKKKEISKSQLNEIITVFNVAINNKEIHIKDRMKTSGMITIQIENESKTYILAPDSEEKNEIEKKLKEILNN